MPVNYSNVDLSTDTFSTWAYRTNQILDALRTVVITAGANTDLSNTSVTGVFTVNGNTTATNITANGTVQANNLTVTTNTALANLVVTGISTVANLTANNLTVTTNTALANLVVTGASVVNSITATSTNTVTLNATGNSTLVNTAVTGTLSTTNLTVTTNTSSGNLVVTGTSTLNVATISNGTFSNLYLTGPDANNYILKSVVGTGKLYYSNIAISDVVGLSANLASVPYTTVLPFYVLSTSGTANTNARYIGFSTGANVDITLPASPNNGDEITIARIGGFPVNILRNGKTIATLASDLTLDATKREVTLIYFGGDWMVRGRILA